ncbi:MAG TPA: TonB-dependent receptor, partial [Acidobacteriaceae bacterium]
APGTEPVEPSDPTKARITAVSTGGSSGLNNELSVDGGDDSDDYIGGFLQTVSPDAIEEFAARTALEGADTGGTTAGSFSITTRRGANQSHGTLAFYDRAAALDARYPIENPAPNPKQPFSQQHYVAALGGPLRRNALWAFASFEHLHEDASIAYSPSTLTQFNALATLASRGLLPGVSSIAVPTLVPIPFRDFFGSLRLDWTETPRSSWYLRASADNYTTHNNLVEQGTLPSTGLLTHNSYLSLVAGHQYQFTPQLLGTLVLNAGALHVNQSRNANLGFALAFPFSSTALTISGFETYGDNQFATPITFFPARRDQQKYQLRYDLSDIHGRHAIRSGINLVHEPVLSGAFPSNTETLYSFPQNPTDYLADPAQLAADRQAGASTRSPGGSFSQNVQRLGLYLEDSWRLGDQLTLNYGLRYSTTYGLFASSRRTQRDNPGFSTLAALNIPLVSGAPRDDHRQFAPRLGFVYAPGADSRTSLRAAFGLYYSDLAQNGWATAFEAVHQAATPCTAPTLDQYPCLPNATANLIDPHYTTPYAIHASAGIEHAFTPHSSISADYIHEQGNHGYRAYPYTGGVNLFTPLLPTDDPRQAELVPSVNVFHADNRSSYDALLVHLEGAVPGRLSYVLNYTLAKAQTWGCVLGELFDYVNGVCDPLHAFAPGDYGPSGEDVRHRLVLAGTAQAPLGFTLSTLAQAESARPFTLTTADTSARLSIHGVPTALDQFRGTPYVQVDLRVSRPIHLREGIAITPFAEGFNLFNRNNPGANYVTNVASLPVPSAQAQSGNVSDVCIDAACTQLRPIVSPAQLRRPAGALGDFFGPGTTVGVPFATQVGVRATF